ncbi:TIGR01777 family protein [Tessaracoccus sp. MC1627]|uniref:TIGR01777 family oxidoreductase n=1 Tax=Tessaracoccus sp. MC1627 TaxID=2760312 RepID=UPI001601C876|nr:TIGR01777 family oxidoreductase [Tessaracoccus sp. MC1627]MBB1512804.1 TIGR01777 family protein [Tessaracoccus sp. MC1627]
MNAQKVVVAGASGLIGRALVEALRADGVHVTTLVRDTPRSPTEVLWPPGLEPLDPAVLEGARALVVLNGASIGRVPWTRSYRRTLWESRLIPTRVAATAVRAVGAGGPALISASGVGYYGSSPGEVLTEASPPGSTFLARLCVAWEAEAALAGPGARVATLRTAPIVHPEGVLKPLILLTRLGVGGPIGRGTQVWPWISLDDEVRAIRHVIDHDIAGPVNLAGPTPATANDLGRALARRLNRPFLIPAPEFALNALLGRDTAESVLTSDADVRPERLLAEGFEFRHRTVEEAVEAALEAN